MNNQHRPSPALVISLVALGISLSGTAFAVTEVVKLKKDTVTSRHVKDNNLKGADVKDGTLTGADVGDDGLTGQDVNESTLSVGALAEPLSGPAGGDLAGTYPDPTIKDGAVGTPELSAGAVTAAKIGDDQVISEDIAPDAVGGLNASNPDTEPDTILDGSVGSADIDNLGILAGDIADGQITSSKIGAGQVRSSDLGGLTARSATTGVVDTTAHDGQYATGVLVIPCEPGELPIGAGFTWFAQPNDELWISSSRRVNTTWEVVGGNDTGQSQGLYAEVYCLAA